MRPLRQRAFLAALRLRSSFRTFARRESAALQRQGPIHGVLGSLNQFARRHPVSVNQWDTEYAASDYAERLDRMHHVPHHAVIFGYLTYAGKEPKVLDVGCGHGRLLQILEGLPFSDYLGMDWSAEGVERARSLSVPHTRFEVADMNHWDTPERFDAVVMNNSLCYADDPRETFERSLGWLTEDGFVVVAAHRSLGARYFWSQIDVTGVDQLAACAVKDELTGAVWDVKALRSRPATDRA